MKKFILGIGAIATVVAPVATTVSCSHDAKNVNGIKPSATVNKPIVEDVVPLDLLSKIDTTPYSIETLKDEANKIGNHTIWKRGIPYEAATQAISTLRAFATFFGYDPLSYYKENNFIIVDNDNNVTQAISTDDGIDVNAQNKFVNVVKKLKEVPRSESEKNESALTIGTINNDSGSLKIAGVDGATSDELEWANGKDELGKSGSQVYTYNDPLHPGQRIMQFINYTHKVVKFINITSGNQVYPTIKPEDEAKFKPYIEALFQKFFAQFAMVSSVLGFAGYPPEQEKVVDFVQNMFCGFDADENVVFNIKQNDFDKFWSSFNNGSHNIEALKLLLVGLDKTFASSQDMIDMTRNSESGSQETSIDSTLDGAASMDVLTFLDWIYESKRTSTHNHTFYDPSKSLEENIKDYTNDAAATTIQGIQ